MEEYEEAFKPTEALNGAGDIVPIGTPGTDDQIEISDELPVEQRYEIALKISCPILAAMYFEALVVHTMKSGKDRREAESMELTGIGYFAHLKGEAAVEKVKRLYGAKE